MAIDKLQNRIRKLKNPSMVVFYPDAAVIPPRYLDTYSSVVGAYTQYAKELLDAMKEIVPAVRFDFGCFALCGSAGLDALSQLLRFARKLEYYVLLDAPVGYVPGSIAVSADQLIDNWEWDGLVLNCTVGSDGIRPFAESMKDNDKDLFLVMRTANRSANEMQDLLTGTRLVYTVAADMAKRFGEDFIGRCGYARVAGIGPATSADCLQSLRSKYPAMFLLIDGYDYSGANAKNCSMAFDKLGHGAIACAGESVLKAWAEGEDDPIAAGVQAAERMKKNLTRYVAVM